MQSTTPIKRDSSILKLLPLLACAAFSGCPSAFLDSSWKGKETREWVRVHKGEGTRKTIHGSYADVYAAFKRNIATGGGQWQVVGEEDHALYGEQVMHTAGMTMVLFDLAAYFYPTDSEDETDVEVLLASPTQSHAALSAMEESWLKGVAALPQFTSKTEGEPSAASPGAPTKTIASDVDSIKARGNSHPDDFALIVGIEKYRSLPAADYGARDAETFKRYAQNVLGVPEENIISLTGQRATRTDFTKYLEEWLPRNVSEDSRVYFYYSGHGAPDPSKGTAYLVPWDGDPEFLETSAYPVSRLYEKLAGLKAKEIVVALDSCFSGAGGRSVIAKGARPLVNKVATEAPSDSKLFVLTAAAGDQIAGSLDDQGHGLFTYYLLKGLQGEADADRSGHVTLGELQTYLQKNVGRAARRQNREQTPEIHAATTDLQLY